ncbi:MAG TPA: hypothetical protein VF773_18310 [Verrucomicrobiae bacterium]
MNILHIERDCAWWFEAATPEAIEQLRELAHQAGSEARVSTFQNNPLGRAFYLKGDPSTFNLQPGTFDEICISDLSAKRSRALEQRVRPWLAPNGRVVFGENGATRNFAAAGMLAAAAQSNYAEKFERTEQALEPALHSLHSLLPLVSSLSVF